MRWIVQVLFVATLVFFQGKAEAEKESLQHKFEELFFEGSGEESSWSLESKDTLKNDIYLEKFKARMEKGLLGKDKEFSLRDQETKDEVEIVAGLLNSAKTPDDVYQVAGWLKPRLNREEFLYCLAVTLIHREDLEVSPPPWYQTLPSYFSPGPEQDPDKCGYFRNDPRLANLHYQCSLVRPQWLLWSDYHSPGVKPPSLRHHFFSLGAAYLLSVAGAGLDANEFRGWGEALQYEHKDNVHTSLGEKIADRESSNGEDMKPTETTLLLMAKLSSGIVEINETNTVMARDLDGWTVDMLEAIVFNTKENMYKAYKESALDACLKLTSRYKLDESSKTSGVLGYPLTVTRDPAYYKLLLLNDAMIAEHIDSVFPPTSLDQMKFPQVQIKSMKVSRLETFFEEVELPSGREGKQKYRLLNHRPIKMDMTIEAENPGCYVIRTFLSPDYYHIKPGHRVSNSIILQMDIFATELKAGSNHVERDLKDSPFFDYPGKKYATKADEFEGQCGLPYGLALPFADNIGHLLVSSVMPGPESSVCSYDDGRPLNFPFHRITLPGAIIDMPNFFVNNVTIHHSD